MRVSTQVSKKEVLQIREEIQLQLNLDQNFRRLQEMLDNFKDEENIYLINIFKIVFQTSKDSMEEDATVRGSLPFNHFSEMFLNSFSHRIV